MRRGLEGMMRRVALWITLLLFVVPSTVMSVGFSALALGQMANSIEHRDFGVALLVPVFLSAGWYGLVTLWRLFFGLSSSKWTGSRSVVWTGLALGCTVDLCLVADMATLGRHGFWEAACVAWPMLAAIHYGIAFRRMQPDDGSPSVAAAR
jgi:hypothetical protein